MYSTARMMNHRCIASMVGELESVLACIFLIRYLVDTPPPLAYGGPYSRLDCSLGVLPPVSCTRAQTSGASQGM